MAGIQELLANSLAELQKIQKDRNSAVISASDLSVTHLKRLADHHFLMPVIKGWYLISDPLSTQGDTTLWYASYWDFICRYASSRFGEDWCLSAEESLSIYTGLTTIPSQITIRSPKANNSVTNLINNTSIFSIKIDLPLNVVEEKQYGLRLYSLEEAVIAVTPTMYTLDPTTMRTALSMLPDVNGVLKSLADYGQTVRGGRLAGALRNVGREDDADTIMTTMKRLGYDIREIDPFEKKIETVVSESPYSARLQLMWHDMRKDVLEHFKGPESRLDAEKFLDRMEAKYRQDAYHSLSIEGYKVTDGLIDRVKRGNWNPEKDDAETKNALAARGYWQAFQEVKNSVSKVLKGGENASDVLKTDLAVWYSELFKPCISAGILRPSDLTGYRSNQVYIRNSVHVPLKPEALRDAMGTFFDLISQEEDAGVRAVLGHFMFTFIHPYMDGNGRIGRFIMNLMLASGGYDWLVIPVERRDDYIESLEKASVDGDIIPFAEFLSSI